MFFSQLNDKLIRLGLSDIRAREEVSSFRHKIKSDPRLNAFVVRATTEDVEQLAERMYAGMIVRSNAPSARDFREPGKYTEMVNNIHTEEISSASAPSPESAYPKTEELKTKDTQTIKIADVGSGEKVDYIGLLCSKLKRSFDRNPTNKLWLALIIPLLAIFVIVAVALFVSLFAVMVGVLAFFFALACVVAVGGTVAALVGIIYGVVQIFTGLAPIGWYEIGISITIIGMTVFASVVFYNCSVRFVPILMRQAGSLFKLFFMKFSNELKIAKGVFSGR